MPRSLSLSLSITTFRREDLAKAVYPLIFASGFASLIYEIVWIRQASLVFGSSALAMSTVLAVFFLGLGLGNELSGRVANRLERPFLWCALLELLLAINGVASQHIFAAGENGFGAIYRHYSPTSQQIQLIRAGLVALILLPPTLAMGATLPLFCRQLIRANHAIAGKLSRIYGCNTLGAAAGCLVTGFFLLPKAGVNNSLLIAASSNLLIAFGFWRLPLPFKPQAEVESSATIETNESTVQPTPLWLPATLFFMIGVVALANELLWTRFISHFVRNSVYSYTIALGLVLIGTAIGSLWLGKRFDRTFSSRQSLMVFALLQSISALSVQTLTHLPAGFWLSLKTVAAACFALLMLPAAVISGACFPLLNHMLLRHYRQAPRIVGGMTAINITGCIVGSIVTGYWLLPSFGLDRAIGLTCGFSLSTALLATVYALSRQAADSKPVNRTLIAIGGMLTAWCLLMLFPPLSIPRDFMQHDEVLIDFAEGYNSSLAVTQRQQEKTLLIDNLWQGVGQRNYQIMVAHLPMLHYPDAEKVLVVGLGAGTTASRFLFYDVKQLDIVDIEPKLFDFTRKHFGSGWMNNPRVRLLAEDGRNYVKHSAEQYDLISVEIGQLNRPGVGVFYTREFYREAAARLREGGMISQFVPLRFLKPNEFASILKTFLSEFPNARLWYNTDELLLMGFKDKSHRLSKAEFDALMTAKPAIRADINMYFWGGARYNLREFPILLAGFLANSNQLQQLAEVVPGEIYGDDKLQLSYSVSDYRPEDQRARAIVPYLRQHLSPIADTVVNATTDAQFLTIAEQVRPYNIGDIVASDLLYTVNRLEKTKTDIAGLLPLIDEAVEWNPLNIAVQQKRQQLTESMQDLNAWSVP